MELHVKKPVVCKISDLTQLGKMKVTMLIKNVLAPSYKADLVAAVKGSKFSLIIDEATDVSLQKTLGMII